MLLESYCCCCWRVAAAVNVAVAARINDNRTTTALSVAIAITPITPTPTTPNTPSCFSRCLFSVAASSSCFFCDDRRRFSCSRISSNINANGGDGIEEIGVVGYCDDSNPEEQKQEDADAAVTLADKHNKERGTRRSK